MNTCEHVNEKDVPCGKPAVAVWYHREHGAFDLCKKHDDRAVQVNAEGWVRAHELPMAVAA